MVENGKKNILEGGQIRIKAFPLLVE